MTSIEQKSAEYAESIGAPLISCGMPEDYVHVDGKPTPIQCSGRGYRLTTVSWLYGEGWDQISQVVEDDGQVGNVMWEDGEPVQIDWEDIPS